MLQNKKINTFSNFRKYFEWQYQRFPEDFILLRLKLEKQFINEHKALKINLVQLK